MKKDMGKRRHGMERECKDQVEEGDVQQAGGLKLLSGVWIQRYLVLY